MASSRDEAIYSNVASTPTFANQTVSNQSWTDAGGGQFYGGVAANQENAPYFYGIAEPDPIYTPPETASGSTPAAVSYGGPPPVPHNPWISTSTYVAPTGIKQATPDIVIFDNSTIDIEFLTDTFFEEFGGQELIKISRSDLINGINVSYNPIKNLSRLNQQYNPNTVIAIAPFQQNLSQYAIDLVLRGINEPYIDRENGYLVIEIDNVKRDESIEVEITTGGTIKKVLYDY